MARTDAPPADLPIIDTEPLVSPESVAAYNAERDRIQVLGKKLGNVSEAARLLATDHGEYPTDPVRCYDLLEASRKLEGASMKTYLRLSRTIGEKLRAARAEYDEHRARSLRLFTRIADGPSDGATA